MPAQPIITHSPDTFLQQFSADPAAFFSLLTSGAELFFVVAVEQMYPQFTRAIPPVRATSHTVLFLTSGTARMNIGNDAYTIREHEVLVVRAGQLYSFAPGDENTGFLCHFHPDFLLSNVAPTNFEFLQLWGTPHIRLTPETAGFAGNLLRRLLAEYNAQALGYPDILRAYLLALLHELNRAYVAEAPAAPNSAASITQRFKQLVAAELRATHRVSDYAEWLHITPGHLSKAVRSTTGKAPARWIEESVVLEAKALLFQSNLSVGEIALEVGVADASYFSRLFRKHTGVAPLAFRKKLSQS